MKSPESIDIVRKDLWEGNKEEGNVFFSVYELILPSLGKSLHSIAQR